MAQFDIIMPKMGESIEEATITKWFVNPGDKVLEDDVLLEIATDKVDSEIPSPVEGVLKKIFYQQDETVPVGTVIAVISMGGEDDLESEDQVASVSEKITPTKETKSENAKTDKPSQNSDRFYSPLVRSIAKENKIDFDELETISGSGNNGRVQKRDILSYLKTRGETKSSPEQKTVSHSETKPASEIKVSVKTNDGDEVIEMSRMRKLIAAHMIHSKQTSAHVTNMLEVDVSNIVKWREANKTSFQKKEGQKLTYLPMFLEAAVKALKDFPMMNAAVDGDNIIIRKNINLGIAVSLEDNNLIVPNIKNADQLNLTGLTSSLNNLALAARSNKLSPDDVSGGTFTVTNFGTFKNDIGTPIINQPEVAILAIGAIKKKPAVIETPEGDMIAIRQKMWLSLTYDHRIIDGALGGAYLRKLGDYIEEFDASRTI